MITTVILGSNLNATALKTPERKLEWPRSICASTIIQILKSIKIGVFYTILLIFFRIFKRTFTSLWCPSYYKFSKNYVHFYVNIENNWILNRWEYLRLVRHLPAKLAQNIPFSSIFPFFQYSLIHDLAPNLTLQCFNFSKKSSEWYD